MSELQLPEPGMSFKLEDAFPPFGDALQRLRDLETKKADLEKQIQDYQAAMSGATAAGRKAITEAAARLLRGEKNEETPATPHLDLAKARFELQVLSEAIPQQRIEIERQLRFGSQAVCEALLPDYRAAVENIVRAADDLLRLLGEESSVRSRVSGSGCRLVAPLTGTLETSAMRSVVSVWSAEAAGYLHDLRRATAPLPEPEPPKRRGMLASVGDAVAAVASGVASIVPE